MTSILRPTPPVTPSNTPTVTPTVTPTRTVTRTKTPVSVVTRTPTQSVTKTPQASSTPTLTRTKTLPLVITSTPTPTVTFVDPYNTKNTNRFANNITVIAGNDVVQIEFDGPKDTNLFNKYIFSYKNKNSLIWKNYTPGYNFISYDTVTKKYTATLFGSILKLERNANESENNFGFQIKIQTEYKTSELTNAPSVIYDGYIEEYTKIYQFDSSISVDSSPSVWIVPSDPDTLQVNWNTPILTTVGDLTFDNNYIFRMYTDGSTNTPSYQTGFSADRAITLKVFSGNYEIEVLAKYIRNNGEIYTISSKRLPVYLLAATPRPTLTPSLTRTITPTPTNVFNNLRVQNVDRILGNKCAYLTWDAPTTTSFTADVNSQQINFILAGYEAFYYDPNSPVQNDDTYSVWIPAVRNRLISLTEKNVTINNLSSQEYIYKVTAVYYKDSYIPDPLNYPSSFSDPFVKRYDTQSVRFIPDGNLEIPNSPTEFSAKETAPGIITLNWKPPKDTNIGNLRFLYEYYLNIYGPVNDTDQGWIEYEKNLGNANDYTYTTKFSGQYKFEVAARYKKDISDILDILEAADYLSEELYYVRSPNISVNVAEYVPDPDYVVFRAEFEEYDLNIRVRAISPDINQNTVNDYLGSGKKFIWPETAQSKPLLRWVGDKTIPLRESIVLDVKEYKKYYPDQPLNLDFRCFWANTISNKPIKLYADIYQGGQISAYDASDFLNYFTKQTTEAFFTKNIVNKNFDTGSRACIFSYDPLTNNVSIDINDVSTPYPDITPTPTTTTTNTPTQTVTPTKTATVSKSPTQTPTITPSSTQLSVSEECKFFDVIQRTGPFGETLGQVYIDAAILSNSTRNNQIFLLINVSDINCLQDKYSHLVINSLQPFSRDQALSYDSANGLISSPLGSVTIPLSDIVNATGSWNSSSFDRAKIWVEGSNYGYVNPMTSSIWWRGDTNSTNHTIQFMKNDWIADPNKVYIFNVSFIIKNRPASRIGDYFSNYIGPNVAGNFRYSARSDMRQANFGQKLIIEYPSTTPSTTQPSTPTPTRTPILEITPTPTPTPTQTIISSGPKQIQNLTARRGYKTIYVNFTKPEFDLGYTYTVYYSSITTPNIWTKGAEFTPNMLYINDYNVSFLVDNVNSYYVRVTIASADRGIIYDSVVLDPSILPIPTTTPTKTITSTRTPTISTTPGSTPTITPTITVSSSKVIYVPNMPNNVSAVAGAGTILLTWSPPSYDGGSAITDYSIEYSSNFGATWSYYTRECPTCWGRIGKIVHPTAYTVTLPSNNNGGYYFRIRAQNAVGLGEPSAISNLINPLPINSVTARPEPPIFSIKDNTFTILGQPHTIFRNGKYIALQNVVGYPVIFEIQDSDDGINWFAYQEISALAYAGVATNYTSKRGTNLPNPEPRRFVRVRAKNTVDNAAGNWTDNLYNFSKYAYSNPEKILPCILWSEPVPNTEWRSYKYRIFNPNLYSVKSIDLANVRTINGYATDVASKVGYGIEFNNISQVFPIDILYSKSVSDIVWDAVSIKTPEYYNSLNNVAFIKQNINCQGFCASISDTLLYNSKYGDWSIFPKDTNIIPPIINDATNINEKPYNIYNNNNENMNCFMQEILEDGETITFLHRTIDAKSSYTLSGSETYSSRANFYMGNLNNRRIIRALFYKSNPNELFKISEWSYR